MLNEVKHLSAHRETLRFAQGDNLWPILFGKIRHHAYIHGG
jgi:hypothetical protein